MAQTIKLKRSSSAGAKPTFNQLALGEMAINTNDGALYIKRDNGTESIVTVHDEDTLHIDTANTRVGIGNIAPTSTLDVTGTVTTQNLTVSSTATIPYDNSISGLTATTVQSAISELNNLVGGGNVGAQSTFSVYSFTASTNQTTFDLNTLGISPNPSYVAGYIQVFLNGILLDATDYTATDGQNIVLGSGASVNDILNVIILDGFDIAQLLRATAIDASAPNDSLSILASGALSTGGFTFPTSDGSAGQVLKTNGSGSLSFQPIPTSLVVGQRTAPVAVSVINAQFTVASRSGNVTIGVS